MIFVKLITMSKTKFFRWFIPVFVIMFFMGGLIEAKSQETAEELFEAALFKKEAEGDLEGAINIFQRIVSNYPGDRKISAKSHLQLGICYEKLGLGRALRAYREVIDNYPDQIEEASEAREKLSALLRVQSEIEKSGSEFRIRQVWAGPEIDMFSAPSLDGRYLSFVDWETGNLAVFDLATWKKRILTKNATWNKPKEFALYSRISPDSKWIVYSWYNEDSTYDLRLIRTDGSGQRILYSDKDYQVHPAGWSSDGKLIAVKRGREDDKNYQILWVSAADGSFRVLKTIEKGLGQTLQDRICHSPDDRYLAFDFPVEKDARNYDINLLATDGSVEFPLIVHPANDKLLGWAPNKEEILFLSDRSGTWDVFVIRVIDGIPEGSPKKVKSEIGRIIPLGFTRDGSFYFSMYARWFYICMTTIDLTDGTILAPLHNPVVGSSFSPEWSPDGESLAYVSEKITPQGPGFFEHFLHIRSLKSGEDRVLHCGLNRIWNPRWSPDGNYILVTGISRENKQGKGRQGLYRVDIRNGGLTALVKYDPSLLQGGTWRYVGSDWSADGKAVFYKVHNRILMKEIETQRVKEIYRNPYISLDTNFRSMAISPDGQSLAFGLRDAEKEIDRLLVIPSSGGEPQELLRLPEAEIIWKIAWTPDGNYVLFTIGEKKGTSLWRISLEGGDPKKLWQSDKKLASLRIHPDGQRLAFYTLETETELWVMENFR